MHRLLPLLLLSGIWPPVSAQSVPDLTPSALELFQKRIDALTRFHDSSRTSCQTRIEREKDPDDLAQLHLSLRKLRLAHHRDLLVLEKDLILLATPKDELKPGETLSGLSTSGRRRIESLRQDVRDDERERITYYLTKGKPPHADERTEKNIDRDEQSLDSLFRRATSRLTRDIEKAKKGIGREQKSRLPDTDEIAKLEQEIKTAESSVAELHQLFHGYKAGSGFDQNPGWPADHPAEALRSRISTTRQSLLKQLRGDGGEGGEDGSKGGLVGGSYVYSANLGVVLDVSGSMTRFIDPLKEEIASTFSGPRYHEVTGCALTGRAFNTNGNPAFAARIDDTMSAIEELTVVHGVDTIYWFTDLQDQIDFAALRRLRYLLRHAGTAFHVKSVDRPPERDLKPLIDDFR